MVEGIARDILAEAREGGYNILAFGRRGSSAIKEFTLGSRAAKMPHNPFDCTLILVKLTKLWRSPQRVGPDQERPTNRTEGPALVKPLNVTTLSRPIDSSRDCQLKERACEHP